MRIFISADLEGISAITSQHQTHVGGYGYERACRLMTREVNVVLEVLNRHGVDDIVINDAHNIMDNLLLEELKGQPVLISGSPKPLSMMQGIAPGFAAAFFIGYHARPGTPEAVIDHTYVFRVQEVKINGQPMSEAGLNGRLAGYYGVPVALISGDQAAVACAREELNGPEGVVVKQAVGRHAARLLPFDQVRERLKAGVDRALNRLESIPPERMEGGIELEVTFSLAEMAAMTLLIPGVERKAGRTVTFIGDDYLTIFKVFRAMLSLTEGIA